MNTINMGLCDAVQFYKLMLCSYFRVFVAAASNALAIFEPERKAYKLLTTKLIISNYISKLFSFDV